MPIPWRIDPPASNQHQGANRNGKAQPPLNRMQSMGIIEIDGEIGSAPPTKSLFPFWDRISAVLRLLRVRNSDQNEIAQIQQNTLRSGAVCLPSIYDEGDDVSVESFYVPHVFVYLFRHPRGDYLWLTAQLDRGFGFAVLILPALDLALSLYPFSVSDGLLRRISQARTAVHRPAFDRRVRPQVVTGYFHMMHVLWNELPAIDRALTQGALRDCRVGHMHQPLGPLAEIFPELRGQLHALPDDDAIVNACSRMMVGLGSWTIPASTRQRLRDAARRLVKGHLHREMREFRELHWPVFWLSVKPPNRSFVDQAQILAELMRRLRSAYPGSGFLLNGVAHPWDAKTNPNYSAWFFDMMAHANRTTAEIIKDIYPRLEPEVRACTRIVSDIDLLEEICWSGVADFYFCHGGSMQNKIAWINDVSGVIHSNSSFVSSARGMVPPTSGRAEYFYLPPHLVLDDERDRYSAMELARKDQNYAISDIDEVATFVIDRFRASCEGASL